MPDPIKNTAFAFDVALLDAYSGNFKANPTLAAGDVKVIVDETSLGNITSLPTVSPAAGTNVKVSLSATEMNGDRIRVDFVDQTTPKEWADLSVVIATGLPEGFQKGVAFTLEFYMALSTDGRSPAPGLVNGDFSVKLIAKDAGTPAPIAGSITAMGNGYYQVPISASEADATVLSFEFLATGTTTAAFSIKMSV